LERFSKDKRAKSGFYSRCKECDAIANKAHYEKNFARGVIAIPESKTCSKCRLKKPGLAFSKNRGNKDGLSYYCKKCQAKISKVWDDKNKARDSVITPTVKTCSRCKIEKLSAAFDKQRDKKDGLCSQCKRCSSARHRKDTFGVSEEWTGFVLGTQGGGCAICGIALALQDRKLHVDHDHVTGKLRGLLCGKCNRGIGLFRDNVSFIDRAKVYLNSPTSVIYYKKTLSKDTKDEILAQQGHSCKICSTCLSTNRADLDHCHKTKLVRGYLCHCCNSGLGQFKDSVELLQKAIDYLNKHK
jgi:hypothetical protein